MSRKVGLLKRILELLSGSVLTLVVLSGGICFTYSSFLNPNKLTHYQGVIEQTKIIGKGRKWFIFTLKGLPFGLLNFHADQDYHMLVASLAPGDTVVASYYGPYPRKGSPTAAILSSTKAVWHLTKQGQEIISLADKQKKEGILGVCLLLGGFGMAWGTVKAYKAP